MISGYLFIANCHSLFFFFFLTWYFSISLFSIRLAFDHWSSSEFNKNLITNFFCCIKNYNRPTSYCILHFLDFTNVIVFIT